MGFIQQAGPITPGHAAKWATDGVLQDGGPNPFSQRVLASLLNADFTTTADQPILLPTSLSFFQLTAIVIADATQNLNAAVGGFYPQAAKAGTPLVANTQVYSALTAATLLMNAALSSYAQQQFFSRTQLPDWAIYFALTTPQGGSATASIYLLGNELG